MHYQVSRGGQIYGPYTLDDLQRYVASGNVLLNDSVKSDEMPDWIPVSELLARQGSAGQSAAGVPPVAPASAPFGSASAGSVPAGYGQASYGQAPVAEPVYSFEDAPNLNWGLVLLFDVLTCGLFQWVWNLIIAAWLRRVQPNATSLYYYAGALVLSVLQGGLAFPLFLHHGTGSHRFQPASGVLWLLAWVVRLIARYSQKASLEEHYNGPEPVGLRLNGVMVFFFGGLYFQARLNRVNAIKNAARMGLPRPY